MINSAFVFNFNFDNIIIGRKIEGADIGKYYIYYYDMEPKEIYLRLPRIRLIYNMDNYKYSFPSRKAIL